MKITKGSMTAFCVPLLSCAYNFGRNARNVCVSIMVNDNFADPKSIPGLDFNFLTLQSKSERMRRKCVGLVDRQMPFNNQLRYGNASAVKSPLIASFSRLFFFVCSFSRKMNSDAKK